MSFTWVENTGVFQRGDTSKSAAADGAGAEGWDGGAFFLYPNRDLLGEISKDVIQVAQQCFLNGRYPGFVGLGCLCWPLYCLSG